MIARRLLEALLSALLFETSRLRGASVFILLAQLPTLMLLKEWQDTNFARTTFLEDGQPKAVPEWAKMLYTYLGKKDSGDLYYSLLFELRHLDRELFKVIKHFLTHAGRGVFVITQAHTPSMATPKKQMKKMIKKEVKKDVKKEHRAPPRSLTPSQPSYFAAALLDPFSRSNAKVPDMNTQSSATVRAIFWTPCLTTANGWFAWAFDPVNPGAWFYNSLVANDANGTITWSAPIAAANYAAMTAASSLRRLVSAGLCFIPTLSGSVAAGTVNYGLSGLTPTNGATNPTGTVNALSNMMNVYRASPTNSVKEIWGPVDYDSFTYYSYPAAGTADVPAGDNRLYISGNGLPNSTTIGWVLFVANYEVIVTNESASILSSSPSPSDLSALQFAANQVTAGGNISGATYYGGGGDQMMKMKQDSLFSTVSNLASTAGGHMAALHEFSKAHNPGFRFSRGN